MRRFLGTAAFVAATVALPALTLAQTATTDTTTGQPTTSTTAQPAASLQQQDMTFAKEAAQGGMMEVDLGKLAADKASDPDVKQFGQRMVTDHTAANDKLMAIAQRKNVDLPKDLSAEGKQMHDKLAGLSGQDFDREYMKGMVDDHKKDIKKFEDEAQNGTDSDLKTFAQNTLPTLRDHLDQAQQINTRISQMASSGQNAEQQMQPAAGNALGQMTAEDLIGKHVVNSKGQDIGTVQDIVLDKDQAIYAILSVGGFLGIGDRDVAVPFDQLQAGKGDDQAKLMSSISKDELKKMPAYKEGAVGYQPAPRDRALLGYNNTEQQMQPAAGTAGTAATTGAVTTPGTTQTAAANPLGQMTAEDLIGKRVVNSKGQDIGTVQDIVLDNQKAVYAVLSVGGFLGMGDKDVAVPFDQLQAGTGNNQAMLMSSISKDELKKMPAYKEGATGYQPAPRNQPLSGQ